MNLYDDVRSWLTLNNSVSFKFGAITMVAGILGVPLGSILSQKLNKRFSTADPLICAFGLILSVPLMTGAMIIVSQNTIATYVLIFFGQLSLNMNWAIVADILLVRYVEMYPLVHCINSHVNVVVFFCFICYI